MSTELQERPQTRIEYIAPRVNIHQDADGYALEVELPGVGREGVDVTLEEGKLTLIGRPQERPVHGRTVYTERRRCEYRRVFDLDPSIDQSKIEATIEQGLLTIRLSKAEAVKPRKITVS